MKALLTRSALCTALDEIGIRPGDTVLVHTKLSALGFVPGAAQTVVEALLSVVGTSGTVMMPTYSGEHSDPAEWRHPPMPQDWIQPIRDSTPAYDPRLTPTRRMGTVAEYFRTYPGTLRSPHPQSSFCANGAKADQLVGAHPLDYRFGPASPLGALVKADGKSLLLGAPTNTNSLLYLALYGEHDRPKINKSAPLLLEGEKRWVKYKDIEISNQWFEACTTDLLAAGIATEGKAGEAHCKLFSAARTIDFASRWLRGRSHPL